MFQSIIANHITWIFAECSLIVASLTALYFHVHTDYETQTKGNVFIPELLFCSRLPVKVDSFVMLLNVTKSTSMNNEITFDDPC